MNVKISRLRNSIFLLLGMGVLIGGVFFLTREFQPKRIQLRMTAGDAAGLRHRMAEDWGRDLVSVGIELKIVPTQGSQDALTRLNDGELDLAFIQGALATAGLQQIRQLTPLHVEPLHLVVRRELYEKVKIQGLSALKGTRINLGTQESGTFAVSHGLLDFVGLTVSSDPAQSDCVTDGMTYNDLLECEILEDLPDAVFTVSSLPSPVARRLVQRHDFRLIELPFSEAFSLDAFLDLGDDVKAGEVDKRRIYRTEIPAFTYSVAPPVPETATETLGSRLLLVGHKGLSNDVVGRLLDKLYQTPFAQAEKPPLTAALLELPPEFPVHDGAQNYRQRNRPLIAGDLVDYFEKILAISATILGGAFFLIQWYWHRRKLLRETNFSNYLQRVVEIERRALESELAAKLDLSELVRLQRELAELKYEAVEKFSRGEVEGEGIMNGFLSSVNEARNHITRLLLHERENVEQLAGQQNRSAEDLWNELLLDETAG